MAFPFEELNMRDPAHVAWVQSQRDPGLWHAAAMAVLIHLGDPHGVLVWLMAQPETDRATAGFVFFGAYGAEYLRGRNDWGGEGLSEPEWQQTMHAICVRAAGAGFAYDRLGLHPGFEAERQACRALVSRGEVAAGRIVPHALLDAPFPPEQPPRYWVEDGAVLEEDPNVW